MTSPVAGRLVGSGVGVKSSLRVAVGVAVGDELGCAIVANEGDGDGVDCVEVQAGRNTTASRRSRPIRLAFIRPYRASLESAPLWLVKREILKKFRGVSGHPPSR